MPSSDESGDDLPEPSSSFPNPDNHTERILTSEGLRTFLVVDHTANLRKNTKISAIWHHGGERRRLDDESLTRYWRCKYCTGKATLLKVDSIPAMATECERVFSAAKRTLTSERNALGARVVEACECLRWWWRAGVISGEPTGVTMIPRVDIEARFVDALVGDTALGEEDVE
jgi:hypothetical protein